MVMLFTVWCFQLLIWDVGLVDPQMGGTFNQCMGMVSTQNHEEFGVLVISTDNPGLERQQQLQVSKC